MGDNACRHRASHPVCTSKQKEGHAKDQDHEENGERTDSHKTLLHWDARCISLFLA